MRLLVYSVYIHHQKGKNAFPPGAMPSYVVRFAQIREDFRLAELDALIRLFQSSIRYDRSLYSDSTPFLVINADGEEEVKKILGRAILVKEIIELWAMGESLEIIHGQVKKVPLELYGDALKVPFKFSIDSFGKVMNQEDQIKLIDTFSFMPLKGGVSMTDPGVTFSLLISNAKGQDPFYYFGRLVGKGKRELVDRFTLKKREYLGTTSMDAELSLIMSNLALVRSGSLVYDPFVGTASLLLTAAAFGATTFGSDIDGRQMRGNGNGSIHSHLSQYSLEKSVLEGLVFDIRQHPWRSGSIMFDSIITDPPYGVRAGAKKIGSTKQDALQIKPEERINRYPKTVPYHLPEIIQDLFDFSSKFLRDRGRLIFWYPVDETSGFDPKEMLPNDTRFVRIAAILQKCREFDRYLMIFELKQTL
jgi:tRNA (guanine10-N2)-methyltransferase